MTGPERPHPWLLVVARGQRELAAELEALFRDDARIQVIEDRRTDQALLPRSGLARPPSPPRGQRRMVMTAVADGTVAERAPAAVSPIDDGRATAPCAGRERPAGRRR